jgi:hypothetical protein
MRRDAPKDDKK